MWNCPKCREAVEDVFAVCWKCGTAPDGTEDPSFSPVAAETDEDVHGEEPNPYSSPQHGSRGSDEALAGMRRCLRFLSFASVLAAAINAFHAYAGLHRHMEYMAQREEMGGLAVLLSQVSVYTVIQLASVSLVLAFLAIAYILWRYAGSLESSLDPRGRSPASTFSHERRLWKHLAVSVGVSMLFGLIVGVYFLL